jgi:tetratricopeptide (TPR) repeat protein
MPVEGIRDYDTAILMADYKDKLRYFELKEEKLTEGKFIPVMTRLSAKGSGDLMGYGEMKAVGFNAINSAVGVKKYFSKEQIRQVFDSAVRLFPDSASVYIDRANYFHKNKDFANAIIDIKKAISLSSNPKNYILLACTMYNSGDYSDKKIEKVLNQCLRKNPKDWNSYNYRAMLYSFRDLPEKAIRDYSKAIKIYPNAASYYSRAEAKKGLPSKYTEQEIQSDYDNATLYKDR